VPAPPEIRPSGEQFELRHEDQVAVVVEVGAALRAYRRGDRDVVHPFPVDRMSDGGHGAVLVPWPNRLADGSFEFDGQRHQTALTEPEKHNAIHGLLRWRPWDVGARDGSRVEMRTPIHPQPGFPFMLDVSVDYELSDSGLTVTTTVTNVGVDPCPYGSGQHPYLSPGPGLVDDCELSFEAATRIEVDSARGLPTGSTPVSGSAYDFSAGRRIGGDVLDDAFTDLRRDNRDRTWVRLRRPDDATAEFWADANYRYLQFFTGDTLAPERARRGIACEPMTCAPNAFNSGEGLVRLEPGQQHQARWGLALVVDGA
jgi:aldose 1-epimerase